MLFMNLDFKLEIIVTLVFELKQATNTILINLVRNYKLDY